MVRWWKLRQKEANWGGPALVRPVLQRNEVDLFWQSNATITVMKRIEEQYGSHNGQTQTEQKQGTREENMPPRRRWAQDRVRVGSRPYIKVEWKRCMRP